MKRVEQILCLIVALVALTLYGCASTDQYQDDQEYSSMPWNTPQQWEGAPSIPGLSPAQ